MDNISMVEEINDLFSRIQSSRSPIALFMDGNLIRSQNPDSQRFRQVQEDYPGSIIGIYTRSIGYDDFVADMVSHFKDMKWTS